ncbi:uncharacterized protein LOC113275482 isoform X2 [Papaver somniferum]|uniref:uncharacterized protein LOC113275482 isoform X2 n=1 Tax=Papaver somniferum TaxID=3469 RepID=UPI000E6F586A|nr:uncharacterized protein LOC113275482 isoform X2 [Papaver somniferum]
MARKCLINWKLTWTNLNRSFWTRVRIKLHLKRRNCSHMLEEHAVCSASLVINDKMQELPCKHLFHPPCLMPWLAISRRLTEISGKGMTKIFITNVGKVGSVDKKTPRKYFGKAAEERQLDSLAQSHHVPSILLMIQIFLQDM